MLHGRRAELKELGELLDGPTERSGVLVRGEAGIGKSALVAEIAAAAPVAGLRVLRTTGSVAERHFAYAGLHQLLYPLRTGVAALPVPQRTALRIALGLTGDGEPSGYLTGLAALSLLAEAASAQPVLIVAEDLQWLDRASAQVLAFVARRIEAEPIVVVGTLRDGTPSPLTEAGLTPMTLERLSDEDSAGLLDAVAPRLAGATRTRVLSAAAGNPLALTELPSADFSGSDPVLPLTERLERTFTDRLAPLPAPVRAALLVAALNERDVLAETLAAVEFLLGVPAGPEMLVPAVEARLVELDAAAVTFRHPLMRSAVAAAAGFAERRAAHLALASILPAEPDRQAWHQAAATAGPDEQIALRLENTAARARDRGGIAAAVAALEQSARLSGTAARRADRLLRAAELAVESGHRSEAERLVREIPPDELTSRRRTTVSWLLSGFEDGVGEDLSRVAELAGLARDVATDGETAAATRILWGAAMRCFWSEPGPAVRRALVAVADRLPVPDGDPATVAVTAYVAPFDRGEVVLRGLRKLAGTAGTDPEVDRYLGSAALQVGAFDLAARFSAAAAPGLRAQGRLGLLPRALAVQAWSQARLGDLAAAVPAAAEAARLAQETGQPYMYGLATAVRAEIAALRGEYRQAGALVVEAERVGLAAGARPVLATVQLARGLMALGEGRFEDAFADLKRVLDPASPSYQLALRAYWLSEFTDAAVRAGQTDAVRDILPEMESLATVTSSPALHLGLRYARAVLAPNDEAEDLFAAALSADLTGWPAERGRVHLAFGEWLRRQRRIVESRTHLRTARETFDALGLAALAERARRELRSAGESSPNRDPDAYDKLTPHELGIAQLAAEGLTNREIGQRLYLSHRTVGTHLHRIFPKLGVRSRAELAARLKTVGD
ncbi:LuxR family transcriptional regulator [Amycolatopsis ultiminotia]|uniref:LuxR family transcriptional regulator n=1 Tax=Amycolatopsis ultiminotia TaxID=543629 RepID=A0ABP6XM13_9PSEU